jgi:hypothetical protein
LFTCDLAELFGWGSVCGSLFGSVCCMASGCWWVWTIPVSACCPDTGQLGEVPPSARGRKPAVAAGLAEEGAAPVCAGKSALSNSRWRRTGEHPRLRGEEAYSPASLAEVGAVFLRFAIGLWAVCSGPYAA